MAAVLLALSASASPHNPDTDWFHDAGWGVFVHYLWDVRPVDFVSLRNSGYFA